MNKSISDSVIPSGMSAFDIAWALLKAGEKPDLFGRNFGGGNAPKPDLFSFTGGAMGNDSGSNPEPKPSVRAKPLVQSVQSKPDIFGTTDNQQVESPSHAEGNGHDLAITGDQAWNDLEIFDDKMQEWIDIHGMPSKIITGNDKGTHQMAQLFAQNNNIECQVHSKKDLKAEHGYGARDVMNQNIVDGASHMLAFPHHEETSTSDAIGRAYQKDIPVHSHFTFSHPKTPLRDHEKRKTEGNAKKQHWFNEWVDDDDAKTHPEEHEGGAKRGLEHAIRRRVSTRGPNSGFIVQGLDKTGQHMRMNTGREGRGGSVKGLVGTPLNASTTRYLPRDTRTPDDKAHDRLVEMALDAAESGHFGINVEPRDTPGMSRMQHIAARRRAKEERNRQAAIGNLPVDFKGGPTDATRAAEEAMWSDIGRLEGNKPNERKVPMHRGKRGDEPEEVDAEQQELERRGRYNEQELRDAKRLGRAPELLSTESDEEGNLEALADPHHINDLRFKVGKMYSSPMIEAFNFIKGF